jgi:predicted PurR-regulated permease PerM
MTDDFSKSISLSSIALPVVAIFAACLIFYYAAPILIPMTLAAVTAYVLIPVVEFLKRLKIPHFLAVLLVMMALLAIGLMIIIFGVSELAGLARDIPNYQQSIQQSVDSVQVWINSRLADFPGMSVDLKSLKINPSNMANLGKIILRGIGSMTSLAFSAFLLFFLTYFIMSDYYVYVGKITRLFGQGREEAQTAILKQIERQLRGFIIIKMAITVGLALVYTIGFLMLGIPYSYIWGPLAGILNLIPYVGPIIGAIPPIIVAGVTSASLYSMIWVGLFIFVVQMLESNVITPRITSNMVDLNPLAVLVATIIWGYLWGGIGIVLAVPITAAIKVFCDNIESLEPIGVLLGGKGK